MQLSDIIEIPDSTVTLDATVGEETLCFQVKPLSGDKTVLVIEPIMEKDKVLSFKGAKLRLNWFRPNEKPIMWQDVGVRCLVKLNQKVHVIQTLSDPVEFNRREDYRQYIGIPGNCNAGLGQNDLLQIVVKNISKSGFAIVSNIKIENFLSKLIRVEFFDDDYGEDFVMVGLIVREETLEDGKYVYGCRLNKQDNRLCRYLNQKQRDELSKIKDKR